MAEPVGSMTSDYSSLSAGFFKSTKVVIRFSSFTLLLICNIGTVGHPKVRALGGRFTLNFYVNSCKLSSNLRPHKRLYDSS